ncbi:hypothetical protein R1flu_020867 [Riccia fluitans]|uniref:Fe2OG dioxygenase domain-containing protein n=1 Tax=Riccia fluitans TaxID=41844 RepID=A0ABD1ZMR2_9MARC
MKFTKLNICIKSKTHSDHLAHLNRETITAQIMLSDRCADLNSKTDDANGNEKNTLILKLNLVCTRKGDRFSNASRAGRNLVLCRIEAYPESGGYSSQIRLGANRSDQWVKVDEVEGLWHCSQFLSTEQQTALTKAITTEGWFSQPQHNQAMRFGDLPGWTLELCALIGQSIRSYEPSSADKIGPLPNDILDREPLFDQMIANSYQPGEGIKAHVDLMRFEDGIAIISLESACVMSFAHLEDSAESLRQTESTNVESVLDDAFLPRSSCQQLQSNVSFVREIHQKSGLAKRVDVLLKPGDLIVSHGPSRYFWTHEIDRSKDKQIWFGKLIDQRQRISVTLRRLCAQKDAD